MSFEQQIISTAAATGKLVSDVVLGVEQGKPLDTITGKKLSQTPIGQMILPTDRDSDEVGHYIEKKLEHATLTSHAKLLHRSMDLGLDGIELAVEDRIKLDEAVKQVNALLAKDEQLLQKYKEACSTLQGYTDGSNSFIVGQTLSMAQLMISLTAAAAVFPPATLGLAVTGASGLISFAGEQIATHQEKKQRKALIGLEAEIGQAVNKAGEVYLDIVAKHFTGKPEYLDKVKEVLRTNSVATSRDVVADLQFFEKYLKNPSDSQAQDVIINRADFLEKALPAQQQKLLQQADKVTVLIKKMDSYKLVNWELLNNREKEKEYKATSKEYEAAVSKLAVYRERLKAWKEELRAYQPHLENALTKQLATCRERLNSGELSTNEQLFTANKVQRLGRTLQQYQEKQERATQEQDFLAAENERKSRYRLRRPNSISTGNSEPSLASLPKVPVLKKSGSVHFHTINTTAPLSRDSSSGALNTPVSELSGSNSGKLSAHSSAFSARQKSASDVDVLSAELSEGDFLTPKSGVVVPRLRRENSSDQIASFERSLVSNSPAPTTPLSSASARFFRFGTSKVHPTPLQSISEEAPPVVPTQKRTLISLPS